MEQMPPLVFGRFRGVLVAEEKGRLPSFLGSTLRGSLAWSLRKLVCLPMCREVAACLLKERCAYAVCFETQLPSNSERLRSLDRVPHPLVLDVPFAGCEEWGEGDQLEFGVTLFGRAIEYFPYFVAAMARMAEEGLGRDRIRFRLQEVKDASGIRLWEEEGGAMKAPPLEEIDPASHIAEGVTRTHVRFVTPVRLSENGEMAKEISFRTLLRGVLGRYSSLSYFHAGSEVSLDFRGLLEAAASVQTVRSDMKKVSLTRWSNRQKRKVPLDGLLGAVEFEGEAMEGLYPFLKAGEVLRVGKGTVFGLGKYSVEPG